MQSFRSPPGDKDLTNYLEPDGGSFSIRTEESPSVFLARPAGIPIWGAAFCLIPPIIAVIWFLVYRWNHGEIDLEDIAIAVMTVISIALFLAILSALNRDMESKGEYFILDKQRNILFLPRSNTVINENQIVKFILVSGHRFVQHGSSSEPYPAYEISLLVKENFDQFTRYPVIISSQSKEIRKIAGGLADYFSVELQLLHHVRKNTNRP